MSPQNEAERLAKLYAGMSDSELEKVAAEAAELTDEARAALRVEVVRRKMDVEVPEPVTPESLVAEHQNWVMLRRFRDLPEAILAKGALDSAGIESSLADENMVRLDWFISNAIGGTRLMVKPEDLESADAVLEQPIPEDFDYGDSENFEQPKCPRCGSVDITYEAVNKGIGYASAYLLNFPIPLKSEKWICHSCGAKWVEGADGEEGSATSPEPPQESS